MINKYKTINNLNEDLFRSLETKLKDILKKIGIAPDQDNFVFAHGALIFYYDALKKNLYTSIVHGIN